MKVVPYNMGACGMKQLMYAGAVAFDAEEIATGELLCKIPKNTVITKVICEVSAAFNAAGTNQITLGTNETVNNLLSADDMNDGICATKVFDFGAAGGNNDITVTAKKPGVAGNKIKIQFKDPTGNSKPLEVTAVNDVIVVSLATSGAGAITSTAADVIAAINSALVSKDLVVAALVADNDGTGVVTAVAATALAGGKDGSYHKAGLYQKDVWYETGATDKDVLVKYAQDGTAASAGAAEFYFEFVRVPEE
jgi:hypothetical protein